MKKIGLLLLGIIFLSNIAIAKDKKIFMGYESYNQNERYIYVNALTYSVMGLQYGDGREQIFKHAVKCIDNKYWYKAKLLSSKGKEDFYSYKFKFYWTLDSKILYVDVNGNQLSCRD